MKSILRNNNIPLPQSITTGTTFDLRTIGRILRIEGLIPFTGCAVLIGFLVILWEVGFQQADWRLFFLAAVGAFLIHIDGHLWNDIMDVDVDRNEKSRETGRDRPLVYGWATVHDYKKISATLTILIVIIAAYLTMYRIYIPILFLIGLFFDYGYNHPRTALAYHPYTEWYIFPWLVVGVTITVVYAATGMLSPLAIVLSLLHGMMVTCFVVSMMRRDVHSDRLGGKYTSCVLHPTLPHSSIYALVTLIVAILLFYPLTRVLGNTELSSALIVCTVLFALVNLTYGTRIDQLCTRSLHAPFPEFEAQANRLMLQQVIASLLFVVVITVLLVTFRGMV